MLGKLKESEVMGALSRVVDPVLNRDLVAAGFVKDLKIERKKVKLTVELAGPLHPAAEHIKGRCEQEIGALGVEKVDVKMSFRIRQASARDKQPIPGVRTILAVASGKGGVGKSTVALNLALALKQAGAEVGVLDCDLYGPSVPAQVGLEGQPAADGNKLLPHRWEGIRLMSMGFLMPRNQPLVWRGPMLQKALSQFLFQTSWGGLDYLILDLPPGTGDVQLSLSQTTPISAAVLVTTPQEVALRDVEKGLLMFQQVKVPVLGIIENMSYYVCPKCGKNHAIFGEGGAQRVADEHNIPLLGQMPLDIEVQGPLGSGKPLLARKSEGVAVDAMREAASAVSMAMAKATMEWASAGPGAMEV